MNLFSNGNGLAFDVFKKTYFPQFSLVDQNEEEEEEMKEKQDKKNAAVSK